MIINYMRLAFAFMIGALYFLTDKGIIPVSSTVISNDCREVILVVVACTTIILFAMSFERSKNNETT